MLARRIGHALGSVLARQHACAGPDDMAGWPRLPVRRAPKERSCGRTLAEDLDWLGWALRGLGEA